MDQRLNIQIWQQKLQTMPWLMPLWAKTPILVIGVMTIILAQLLAQVSWQIMTPAGTELAHNTTRSNQTLAEPQKSLAEVVNAHLFGKLAPTTSAGPITAPATRLKLNLNGVFASENPKLAMAIISDASGKQKHYRIGDAVPGGAKLHAIYPDRVILDRLGKLETLKLPREVATFNATTISPSQINSQLPTVSSKIHKLQASEEVKQMRETMMKSPQDLWKKVRIEPVMADGKIEGYRFAHNDKRLMQSIGLTNEDVIIEINGMILSDPSVLYELMSQITTMDNVSLTIKRKGQTETIEIQM